MNRTIIKRPLITEKSMTLAQKGWYTFAAEKFARKEHIAREIAAQYNVTVRDVRTVKRSGKARRVGRRMTPSVQPDWKVAMVRLAKGQSIPVFEVSEGKK